MEKIEIYDKVSWHFPEGQNCPSLDAAKRHFKVIMEWLNKHNLLTDEGKESLEFGIDSDFTITSDMITEEGNNFFQHFYSNWLKTLDYSKDIDMKNIDSMLEQFER